MPIIPKFSETRAKLQELAKTSPAVAKAAAIELAAICVKEGKQGIIPRDTGNMRSTARVEKDKDTVKFVVGGITGKPSRKGIGSKFVDYAVFVNNGTSRQQPQFFMERSLASALTKRDAIFQRILDSWLKGKRL